MPNNWLLGLTSLLELNFDDAPLSEVPDFTEYNTSDRTVMVSFSGDYPCDGSMIKLKLAEATGVIALSTQPSCSSPWEFVGQTQNDVDSQLMMKRKKAK